MWDRFPKSLLKALKAARKPDAESPISRISSLSLGSITMVILNLGWRHKQRGLPASMLAAEGKKNHAITST